MNQAKPLTRAVTAALLVLPALLILPSPGWSQQQNRRAGIEFQDCTDCPTMVVVPSGRFMMGSPSTEEGRDQGEGPQHTVAIANDFAAGKFEVTRSQYAQFVGETGHSGYDGCFYMDGREWKIDATRSWRNPGFAQSDSDPVVCVNWDDAKAYVSWLSRKSGEPYRLLSESEWEYAARAGTNTQFYFGESISDSQANYNWAEGKTVPVGRYASNAFGLHDMHGNVLEWTEDCSNDSYDGAPSDGSAWVTGNCERRILRGGAWFSPWSFLRSAYRYGSTAFRPSPYSGFRVARTLN